MAVTVRQRQTRKGSYWQADIRLRLPDGTPHRERVRTPGKTRAQAVNWARQREVHIIRHGLDKEVHERHKEVKQSEEKARGESTQAPTLRVFAPRFLQDHVEANRCAPATRKNYESVLRSHLLPVLGRVRLDAIGARHVQKLKRRGLKPGSTNAILKNLTTMLRQAQRWGVIEAVPEITFVKKGRRQPEFYDFDVYERLVSAAASIDETTLALVLLGGDAGLRRGELRGLRWSNVHVGRESLCICDNFTTSNHVRLPKGGRTRWVPMSDPLIAVLGSMARLGEHVLCYEDGAPLSYEGVRRQLKHAQQRARLPVKGPHILRHTFCSHLAMRGTAQKVIQELAGHASGSTTEVYMHLAPRALKDAIRDLRSKVWHYSGTGFPESEKLKNDS